MKFTLVTTCLNEMSSFPRWQGDVSAQTRQPDEIVIVDAESTDGTRERLLGWAGKDPRVRVRIERCSVARGRNIAVEMAAYDHIVSTDMGVRLSPQLFEEIVRPFELDESVEVVAGASAIDADSVASPAARAEYYIESGGVTKLGPGFVVLNRSVAYKKRVYEELGGLPEDLTRAADDSVFGRQVLQAGYSMAFAPTAMVYWQRPKRLRDFWRETAGYGFGDGEAAIKMPFAFRLHLRGLIPATLVPFLTGCRLFQSHVRWRAIRNALASRDLVALLYFAPLLFGRGYYFGKSYVRGYERGKQHCTDCRNRLARGRQHGVMDDRMTQVVDPVASTRKKNV